MNKEVGVRITVGTAGLQNVDKLTQALKNAGAETVEFENDAKDAATALNKLQGSVDSLGAGFTTLGGLAAGAFTGREFVDTLVQAESLQRGLAAVLGSTEAAAKEFDYLKKTSNELGLELLSTGRAYLNLAASTQGTNLEGQATRDIFEAVSRAMSTLGKSSAETENALRAVGQMASKGTVSMEELRGQLGEALPGALKAAADGMGVTVQQLVEMVSSGEVLASDLLPRLAEGLNKVYANGSPPDGMIANWNRLKNTISETVLVIGENGMGKALSTLAGTAAVAIGAISEAFVNVGKDIGEFAGAVATGNFELGTQAERIAESEKRLKALSQTAGLTAPDALGKLEGGAKDAGNAVAGLGEKVLKSANSYKDLLDAVDAAQRKVSDLSRQFVNERATAAQVQEATDKLTEAKKKLTEAGDRQQKQSALVVQGLKAETEYAVKLIELETARLKVKRDELEAQGRVDEAKKLSIGIADLELKATERGTLGKRQEANEIIRSETLRQQELGSRGLLSEQIKAESDLRIRQAQTTLLEADAANVNTAAKGRQLEKLRSGTVELDKHTRSTETNTERIRSNSEALQTNAQRRERVIELIDDQVEANRRLEGLSSIRQAGDPGNRLAADGGDNLSVLGPTGSGPTYGGQVPRPNAPGNWVFDQAAYAAAGYPSNPDMARSFWRRTDLPNTGNGIGPFGGGRAGPSAGGASAGADIERRSTTSAGYTITFVIGGQRRAVTADSQSAAEALVRDLEAAFRAAGGG